MGSGRRSGGERKIKSRETLTKLFAEYHGPLVRFLTRRPDRLSQGRHGALRQQRPFLGRHEIERRTGEEDEGK